MDNFTVSDVSDNHFIKFKDKKLDFDRVEKMRGAILENIKKEASDKFVSFDMENVDYISSPFLSMVVFVAKEERSRGKTLSIKKSKPFLKKVFKEAGIDRLVNIG